MNHTSMKLNFGESSPVQMRLEFTRPQVSHWHSHIEIYYVLDGEMSFSLNGRELLFSQDQLVLVNPFDIHCSLNEGCCLAIFSIDMSPFYQKFFTSKLHFDCNSLTTENREALLYIKNILARFVKNNINGSTGKELLNQSLSFELLHVLTTEFSATIDSENNFQDAQMLRIKNILEYTTSHYTERISLSELAKKHFLTVPYMSRFFKNMMGCTFTEYMNQIRLSHVIYDLSHNNYSTEILAELHGFSSARSLVTTFKERYGVSPAQYKRRLKHQPLNEISYLSDNGTNYKNYLSVLSKHLKSQYSTTVIPTLRKHVQQFPSIDLSKEAGSFIHNYHLTANICFAKEILYSENQGILRMLQKTIGFRFLGFHGLLDDDMMVYSEDNYGNPNLSFTLIDRAFDFLKSIGLRPILELSFMPKALAESTEKTAFLTNSIISMPKDMEKWNFLIEQLILHLMHRYGSSEVCQWPIYLWNAPDIDFSHLGGEILNNYLYLYSETWKTVKKCNPNLQFGSPNFSNPTIENETLFEEFILFSRKYHCEPDFLCMNCFPMNQMPTPANYEPIDPDLLFQTSPDALQESLQKVHTVFRKQKTAHLPLHICSWNSTISHRDLLNDTIFKATYIVKNVLENFRSYHSIGYWSISDMSSIVQLSNHMYHGGMGLFTSDGTPKASYYAFEMLAQMGDTLVYSDKGIFITKTSNEWQIMLYNYHHYSALYARGELFDVTETNRYTPFDNPSIAKFIIPFTHIKSGNYIISETILNQENGSSFDKWVELGAMPIIEPKEYLYLRAVSVPKLYHKDVTVENDSLMLTRELMPHEVRLIKIRPKYL